MRQRLRDQGEVRAFGIAADGPEDLEPVVAGRIAVDGIQAPYSLLHPEAGVTAFPGASVRGVGIVARSCFAAGLFAPDRSVDELQVRTERWQEVLRLRAVADQLGRPLLELALRFSLRSVASVTILGTSSEAHLHANLALLDRPPLSPDEVDLLLAPNR